MKQYKVILAPEFLNDLDAIVSWIAVNSLDNAVMVLTEVENAVDSLKTTPNRHPKAYESSYYKGLNLRQFICMNHRIIYNVTDITVEVVAILNCRQMPRK